MQRRELQLLIIFNFVKKNHTTIHFVSFRSVKLLHSTTGVCLFFSKMILHHIAGGRARVFFLRKVVKTQTRVETFENFFRN